MVHRSLRIEVNRRLSEVNGPEEPIILRMRKCNSARKLHACCVDFKPPTRPCISGATCAYPATGLSSSILSGFLIGAVIGFGPSRDSSWLPQAQPCDLRG